MTTQAHEWTSFETHAQTRAPQSSRATAKAKTRAPRLPIARVEHVMLADVTGAAREKLVDDTYRISVAYFPSDTREDFEAAFLKGDPTWVFLFYGQDGALAGFAAVSNLWVHHEGEDYACFKGCVCIDSRYKLTWRARLPVVREALKFKLRHPLTPTGYMGMAATPSGYRVVTTSVPRVYPSRHEEMPEPVRKLILEAVKVRGLELVDAERLLVRATSSLAEPERVRESRGLHDDPDARYYVERNPEFENHYMLVWAPLGFRDLARGATGMLWRHARAVLGAKAA
jgi:hypothetical protein